MSARVRPSVTAIYAREVVTLHARVTELEQTVREGDEHGEALLAKIASLSPHETCGCSYDKPGDVCMHHSPALAKAEARVTELEAENARLHRMLNASDERKPYAPEDTITMGKGHFSGSIKYPANPEPSYTLHTRIIRYRNQEGYGIHSVVFKGTELVAWDTDPLLVQCDYNQGPPGILEYFDKIAHAVACPIVEERRYWEVLYRPDEEYIAAKNKESKCQ